MFTFIARCTFSSPLTYKEERCLQVVDRIARFNPHYYLAPYNGTFKIYQHIYVINPVKLELIEIIF